MIQYLPCITGDVKLANSSSTTQKFLADMPTTLQNLVTVSANPVPPHNLQKPTSSDATLTPCNPTDPITVIPITENHSTGANPAAILVPQSSSIVQPATVIAQVIDPIEISLPSTEPATGTATPVASPIESSPQPQLPDAKPEIIPTIATKEEIEEFLALDKDLFEKLQQEMYDYEDKMWHAKLAGCKPTDPVTATPVTVNHSTGVDLIAVLDFQSSSNIQPATDIPVTENHSTGVDPTAVLDSQSSSNIQPVIDIPVTENHSTSVNSATALVPQSSSTVQPTTVIAQVIETGTEPATGAVIPITSPIKSSPQPQLPDAAPENTPVTEEELEGFLAAYDRVSFDKILQELFDYVDKTDQSGVASCSQAPRSNADATLTAYNPTDPITVIPVTENHPTGVNSATALVPQRSSNAQSSSIAQPATVIAQVTDPIEISLPSTEPATKTATSVASPIKSSPQPQLPDAAPENTPLTEEQLEEFQAAYDKLCVTFGDDFLDFLENPSTFTGGNIDTVPSPVDSHANAKNPPVQSENSENGLPKNELIPGTEKAAELPTVTSVQLNPTGNNRSEQLGTIWVPQALSHEQGDDDAFEKFLQELYDYEDKTYHAKQAGCKPTDPITDNRVTVNHSTGVNPTAILVPQSSNIAQPATVIAQVTDPIEISLPSTEPATKTATPVASPIKSSPQPQLPDAAPENTPLTEEQLKEFQAAYDKLCVTFGDDFLDFLENPSTFTGGNIDTVPSPADSHANTKNPPVQSENSENGLPKSELIPGTEKAVELPTVTSKLNPTGNKSILQLGTIWVPQAPCQEQVDEDPLDKFFRMQELYEYEDRAFQSGAAPYTQVPGSNAGQANISPAAGCEDDQNVTVSRKRPREPEVEDDIQCSKKIKLEAP